MAEYKSEVKKIFYPIERVYERLSDLSHLEGVKRMAQDPALRERILQQAGDKATPEQLDSIIEKLEGLEFTRDSVSGNSPVGDITLQIIERESPKCVKFELQGAPIQANMWVQLLPAGDSECALRLTVKADLNFFIKQMIGSKLQQGVDGLAQMLASIPY
ncbi:MAG: SRPBCC family protein [Bacteroidaceae bacterium]|nr:SRPBCC family protein [Bacteroidaceae bacterium]